MLPPPNPLIHFCCWHGMIVPVLANMWKPFVELFSGSCTLAAVHNFSYSCCVKFSASWSVKNLPCLSRSDVSRGRIVAVLLLHLCRPCWWAAPGQLPDRTWWSQWRLDSNFNVGGSAFSYILLSCVEAYITISNYDCALLINHRIIES